MRHAARYLVGFVCGLLVCLVLVLFLTSCSSSSSPALTPVEIITVTDDVGQAARPCLDSAHDLALVACEQSATALERSACTSAAMQARTLVDQVLAEVHRLRCQVDPGGCQ